MKLIEDIIAPLTDTLTAHMRRVLALHCDPVEGSPYWIDQARRCSIKPDRDIRTLDDLRSAEVSALRALVGNALAIDLKDQVGIKVAPEDVQVKANKRKGQIALGDYDGK